MPPLAQNLRNAKQHRSTFFRRNITPRLKRLIRRFDGAAREFFRRLLKTPDNFGFLRRVEALKGAPRLDALAADHERVLAPQFAAHTLNRPAHRPRILFSAEICKRLVTKFAVHAHSC
jgi:hypothetical protein